MWQNSQPVFRDIGHTQFALGHNGNLTNTAATSSSEAGMLPGHRHLRHRPDGRAAVRPASPARSLRRATSSRGRCTAVLPQSRGRVLAGADGPRPRHRRPRPATGSARSASASSTAAGCWRRRRPALDIVGAHFVRELEPGEMVVIDADGVRSVAAVRRRAHRPEALPVRVRVLRPARLAALRPQRPPGPGPHGRAAGRAGAGRGRHGRSASPSRASPRPRASAGARASRSATGWSRTATSAARSSRRARRCVRSACA